MRVYLLTFTSFSDLITREEIQNCLDNQEEISKWYGIMPNAILYASNARPEVITAKLVGEFGDNIMFLITLAKRNKTGGYINKSVWDFINSPKNNYLQTLSDLD